MPDRFLIASDFPPNITLSITPPPNSQEAVNVLILLHGLGDTNASFTDLAKQLCLPNTVCIAVQAPTPVPFDLGGFHWGDDIIFDQRTGQMEYDTGFTKSMKMVGDEIITHPLLRAHSYHPTQIHLLGYVQGGTLALATALALPHPLGSIITIGGPLPTPSEKSPDTPAPSSKPSGKNTTPVLACGGSSQTLLTPSAKEKLKEGFENVEVVEWKRAGDGMPRSREEMAAVMGFWARRLGKGRMRAPEGWVEVG